MQDSTTPAASPGTTIDLTKLDLSEADLNALRERLGNIDLSRVDLSKVDLSGIDFSNIDLSAIDFSKLDPSKVDLSVFGIGTAEGSGAAMTFESILNDPNLGGVAAAIAIVGGTLLGGLILWFAGRKLVKPAFALLGAVAGGLLGAIFVPASGLAASLPASLPPMWVGLGGGVIIGLIISIAAFRFALIAVSALSGSALATLIAVVAVGLQAAPDSEAPPLNSSEMLLKDVPVGAPDEFAANDPSVEEPSLEDPSNASQDDRADPTAADAPEGITAENARAFFGELAGELRETYWEPVPTWKRSSVIGAGFLGLLVGAAIGLLMPNRSATIITAFAGAGLWVPSVASIATWAGTPKAWFDHSPTTWLVVWIVISGLGVIVQLSGSRRKKRRN